MTLPNITLKPEALMRDTLGDVPRLFTEALLPEADRKKILITKEPVGVMTIAKRIAQVLPYDMQTVRYGQICGWLQYMSVASVGPLESFLVTVAPFIVVDLIKIIAATAVARIVMRTVPLR